MGELRLLCSFIFSANANTHELFTMPYLLSSHRNILNKAEVAHLTSGLEHEQGVMQHAWERDDGNGRYIRLASWQHPGNDVTGMVSRAHKFVDTFEKVLKSSTQNYTIGLERYL